MKNRQRNIGASVLSQEAPGGYHGGSPGTYSLDRNAEVQASLHAMQIQQQPMRERPQAVSLQKKAVLQKRLEPISLSSVGSPVGHMPADRVISPKMPKTTTAKTPINVLDAA